MALNTSVCTKNVLLGHLKIGRTFFIETYFFRFEISIPSSCTGTRHLELNVLVRRCLLVLFCLKKCINFSWPRNLSFKGSTLPPDPKCQCHKKLIGLNWI